jgi:hypothetical protein
MVKFLFVFILAFFAGATVASAQELFEYNQSARALGMGGVRVIDETDSTMMYWNPANLSQIAGFRWDLVNVGVGTPSKDLIDFFNNNAVSDFSSLSGYYGKNVSIRLNGNSTFAVPYFGLGGYGQASTSLVLHNPAYTNLNLAYFYDTAYAMGAAIPLGPTLYFGSNIKRVTRTGGSTIVGASTLANISNSSFLTNLQNTMTAKGTAWGADVGLLWKAPVPMSPALSVSWIDVGKTTFTSTGTAPERIDDNMMINFNTHADFAGFGYAAGLEYRHVMNQPVQIGKKLHMGLELSMPLVDLRTGFYQGYTTYGLGIDLWVFKLDAAMYTVEKGVYPGQSPDNRYEVSLKLQLGFDPSFALMQVGSKRRLKQRR